MTIPHFEVKDLYITGTFPLYQNLKVEGKPRAQYYDYESFTNLTDPKIKCLWEHDKSMQIASIGAGNMKLWLANAALNLIVLFDEHNIYSRSVFLNKMVDNKFIGLSPGYTHDPTKEPVDADGSKKQIIHLNEISLCRDPVHTGSSAILHSDLNMKKIAAWEREQREWLEDPASRKEADKFKDVLPSISGRRLTPAEVATFKNDNPYFQRVARNQGYETAVINPYK